MLLKILKWLLKLVWKLFLLALYAASRIGEIVLQNLNKWLSKNIK